MKILVLTQYFPPEMGAPPARLFELALRLRDKGNEVTILTAMPNRPTGRIFEGYRHRLRMTEDMEGIKVVRTWIRPTKSTGRFLPRLMCDLSFILTSVLFGIWGLGKQDVLVYQSPPLFTVLSAWVVSGLTRAKSVMWAGDIWPDVLIQSGQAKEGMATRMMFWLEKFGYKHSALLALTNPGAVDRVHERFPNVPATVWSNGVDTEFFRPDLRSDVVRAELGAGPDDFLVGYIGLHGRFQGLTAVIDAAEQLADRPSIKFIMMGEGTEKAHLQAMAAERGLTNLRFFEPRPKQQIPPILASCDASLVPLLTRMPGTMPSKTYEGMAAGAPVIVAKGCEAEPLVTKFNVGRSYEPLDGAEMAAAILELCESDSLGTIRDNCVQLAQRFNRDVLAERTHDTILALCEGRELPEVQW